MGIFVDNFAGGGGASLGIKLATGREVDIAINHDAGAIAMHEANHKRCRHYREDVWSVDPAALCNGEEVDLAWFSPDCKHFSRAKGAKPVEKKIRGLAWVAIKWARAVRPKLVIIENVREFQDWGPLIQKRDDRGRIVVDESGSPLLVPDPERKGITFRRFVGTLRNLGYCVEWRELNAADYGAPTHRRRLFLIARCDGEAITWPEATHGPKRVHPWRTAAECIDWSLPCPSIFERKRPLREKTLQRIARGLKRFVIDAAEPFIVGVGGRMGQTLEKSVFEPMSTTTAKNDKAVIVPYVVDVQHSSKEFSGQRMNKPLRTVTATPKGGGFALTAPILAPMYGKSGGAAVNAPSPAASGCNHHMLVGAFLAKHFGGVTGVPVNRPLPTITARGTQTQLAAAYLIHMNHGAKQWSDVREPLRTVVSNNHAAEVRAFLIKYYGTNVGQPLSEPLQTVTARDRFGLVTIAGVDYQIVDIGMRMLSPRELARAQGFPDSYELTGTKTNQVARIGNSVCPPIAAAIVRANYKRARKAVSA